MGEWLLNLPVLWMGVLTLGAIYLVTAAIYLFVTALAVGDRGARVQGDLAGHPSPLSVIFALLVGFLAAQVWNDADRASGTVNREASALRAVILLATAFPGEPESRLHELVRSYIQDAVTQEWPAMSRQDATLAIAPARLAEALDGVGRPSPAHHPQPIVDQLGEMDCSCRRVSP
jgi:hypothetical protein